MVRGGCQVVPACGWFAVELVVAVVAAAASVVVALKDASV